MPWLITADKTKPMATPCMRIFWFEPLDIATVPLKSPAVTCEWATNASSGCTSGQPPPQSCGKSRTKSSTETSTPNNEFANDLALFKISPPSKNSVSIERIAWALSLVKIRVTTFAAGRGLRRLETPWRLGLRLARRSSRCFSRRGARRFYGR